MTSSVTKGSRTRRFLRSISARAVADAVGDALGQALLALLTLTWTKGLPMLLGILISPLACSGVLDGAPRLQARRPEVISPTVQPSAGPAEVTEPIECTDRQERTASFRVVLFSRAYSWPLESTDSVELNRSRREFQEALRAPGLAEYLETAPEVVAVGTASCEGYPEHREREIRRARERARQLLEWIEHARGSRDGEAHPNPVHALNLGVYTGPCTADDTWRQRQILLFAVYRDIGGPNLLECLSQALRSHDDLRYLATRYEPGLGPEAELF